jgi:hypothetical protein
MSGAEFLGASSTVGPIFNPDNFNATISSFVDFSAPPECPGAVQFPLVKNLFKKCSIATEDQKSMKPIAIH